MTFFLSCPHFWYCSDNCHRRAWHTFPEGFSTGQRSWQGCVGQLWILCHYGSQRAGNYCQQNVSNFHLILCQVNMLYFCYRKQVDVSFFFCPRYEPKKDTDRLTLLKSVHIFKKHRVQYEMRTHYRCLEVMRLKSKLINVKAFIMQSSFHKLDLSCQNICFKKNHFIFMRLLSCLYWCVSGFLAVTYNRLHCTGVPWIHPEESPRRCCHGSD